MVNEKEMKVFRCKADFTFQAKDIDDALIKLSKHFKDIKKGKDSQLVELGEIQIKPTKDWGKE